MKLLQQDRKILKTNMNQPLKYLRLKWVIRIKEKDSPNLCHNLVHLMFSKKSKNNKQILLNNMKF